MLPTKCDSLEFLRATMQGKIWPTREQIYAAKSVLPIEHPPAVTVDGRSVEEIGQAAIREYQQGCEGDDVGEQLVQKLLRLRAETPPAERVRSVLQAALAEQGEVDPAFVDRHSVRIPERHGEQPRPQRAPVFRSKRNWRRMRPVCALNRTRICLRASNSTSRPPDYCSDTPVLMNRRGGFLPDLAVPR
jgi:hypothetical protein